MQVFPLTSTTHARFAFVLDYLCLVDKVCRVLFGHRHVRDEFGDAFLAGLAVRRPGLGAECGSLWHWNLLLVVWAVGAHVGTHT